MLVHGLGMDHSMWDWEVPEFSKSHQVIVYDLRGHGQSESPDHSYSIDLMADDLDLFVHFLGLKKAVILGLSQGGRSLLRFALKSPQELQAIILADAQSETLPDSVQGFQLLAETARKEGMSKAAKLFFSWPGLQMLAKRKPERFEKEKKRFVRMSPIGLANSCLAITSMEPLTSKLGVINIPTLALAGEQDEPYLPYLDLYARQIPHCQKQTVPRAGHLSNLENPQAFNEIVLSFLKGLGKA